MANILSWLGNAAQGVERQINPFDNGATYSKPTSSGPVPGSFASQAAQAPVSVAKSFGNALGTTFDAGKLGMFNLLHNQQAANQSRQQMGQAFNNSIIGQVYHPAAAAFNALSQTPLSPTYGMQQKLQQLQQQAQNNIDQATQQKMQQIKQGITAGQIDRTSGAQAIQQLGQNQEAIGRIREAGLNKQITDAGFKPGDSAVTMGRKFISNAGQTAANAASFGQAGAESAAINSGWKPALLNAAKTANYTGLSNVLGGLGQDNVSGKSLIKDYGHGAFQGTALAGLSGLAGQIAEHTPTVKPNIQPLSQDGSLNIGQMAADLKNKLTPKLNGLTKDQIINDPNHLQALQAARDQLKAEYAQNPNDQYTPTTKQAQTTINALHDIKNTYGHDFITGSNADRVQRINQFLDQNNGAIAKYQKSLMSNQVGAVGKDVRPTNNPPLTPAEIRQGVSDGILHPNELKNIKDTSTLNTSTSGTKVSGLTKGIQKSDNFSPQLKEAVNGIYTPFTNKAATTSTAEFMKQPLKDAQTQVMQTLSAPTGHSAVRDSLTGSHFGKQEVSNAGAVIQALDAKGDVQGAQAVHDLLAKKLTNAGQTGQAASLIYNRTPEGMKYMAQRDLTNAGVKITPELQAKMNDAIANIKSTPKGSRAQNLARGEFQKLVGSQIPTSASDKALSLWKSGILSSPATAVKVGIVSPVTSALENIKDIPAAGIDRLTSLVTGKRSLTAPNLQNVGAYANKFLGQGLEDAKTKLTQNITMPGSSSLGGSDLGEINKPHSTNFGVAKGGGRTALDKLTGGVSSKILNGYTTMVPRVHGATTAPFYEGRGAQSIMQSAQAEAINQGLKGADKAAFIQKYVADPPKSALADGLRASEYATSQQKTALGSAASGLQRTLPGGQIIAPITRIPGAVATQVINYSPVGAAKTAISAIVNGVKGGTFDQRAFSEGIGRSLTGTGIMYAGVQLANQGRMTGQYPTGDKSKQALWTAANVPPNGVYVGGKAYPNEPWKNTGGKWVQVGSAGGPAGQSLLTGGAIADGYKQGGVQGAVIKGSQGAAKIVTDQPYLTGVSGAMTAVQSPDQAKSFIDQTAGSIVPNALRGVAAATDPLQRQTTVSSPLQSVKNSITNGIPGLREQNQPKLDVFGNSIPRNDSPLGTLLNPLKPQSSSTNPVINAMGNVYNTPNANTGKPTSTLTSLPNKVTYNTGVGAPQQLTDAQRTQFIQATGQAAQDQLSNIVQTPQFKALDPQSQATVMKNIMNNARATGKNQLTVNNATGNNSGVSISSVGTPTNSSNKVLTAAQVALDKQNFDNSGKNYQIINGNVYQRNSAGNVTITPQQVYQYNVGKATLINQQNAGNLSGWMQTAQGQLASIQKQLSDPSTDPLQALTLQNDATAIQKQVAKYSSYGGFTKPKSGRTPHLTKLKSFSTPKVASGKAFKTPTFRVPKAKVASYRAPKPYTGVSIKTPKVTRKAVA